MGVCDKQVLSQFVRRKKKGLVESDINKTSLQPSQNNFYYNTEYRIYFQTSGICKQTLLRCLLYKLFSPQNWYRSVR